MTNPARLLMHILAASMLLGSSLRADEPHPELIKVSAEFKRTPLREAAERYFKAEWLPKELVTWDFPRQCLFDPDVPNVPITLSLKGMSWHPGLLLIVGAAWEQGVPLTLTRDGNIYAFRKRRTAPGADDPASFVREALARKLDLDLKDANLREGLHQAFKDLPARVYSDFDLADEKITVQARDVTPEAAVQQVVRELTKRKPDVTYTRGGHFFLIHLKPPPKL